MSTATIHRCKAENLCDESTIQRYVVRDHEGRLSLVEYCAECAELARVDFNGETAAIVGPLTDEHCPNCSGVLDEPVTLDNCSSLTHRPLA